MIQLFGRSLHPELYESVKTKHVKRGRYQATLAITNAGHVVSWQVENLRLCEVATSAHEPLPKFRRLMSHGLRGAGSDEVRCAGGVRYETNFALEQVSAEAFQTYQDELTLAGAREGMLVRFDVSTRLGLGALSYMHADCRDRVFRVRALHTFPDDLAIVKSESRFLLPSD